MKKILLATLLLAGGTQFVYAQNEAPVEKKAPVVDQYFGVQVNQLVRQVLNFSNTSSTNTINPYLLNYSINSKNTGWGARLGVGYNYSSTSSNDGITSTDIKLNDLAFRIGLDKVVKISDNWDAGFGLDFVGNMNDDHTVNVVNSSFGGQNTDTKTTISSSTASSCYNDSTR